jgi:CRP-like cAMP-binding protein
MAIASSPERTTPAILVLKTANRKMNSRIPPEVGLDRLGRLKNLSWLSEPQLALLGGALALANFKRRQVILTETAFASDVSILLTGIARITCINSRNERVTVALLPPGPIPEFPTLAPSQSRFQCEAYNDCRVGRLSREHFDRITGNPSGSGFKNLRENDLKQWYRLFLRSSILLNLSLRDRIAITLIELCADFGTADSRGTLLRVFFSQRDIANLVGASRPRVTEYIAQLESENFVIRQGRQMIVRPAMLRESIGKHAPLMQLNRSGSFPLEQTLVASNF